jgi:predicted DCC family thiol-disulfide oxidoreductase YuxK
MTLSATQRHVLPDGIPENLIVFDAQCVFCSGFARFMHAKDRRGMFRFASAQSDLGQRLYLCNGLDPQAMETNIVYLAGRPYLKMAAFAAAMRALGRPWSALSLLGHVPRPIADWLYDRIARNRYVFGRKACPMPPPELRSRLIG